MDRDRAAHEVDAVTSRRQLENQVLESDGVVVAYYPFMLTGKHQLQLEARQFDESAFGLGWSDREAPIEVCDEMLLEITIGRRIIGDAMVPELLRQPALNGAEGTLATAAGLWRERQDLMDAEGAQGLAHLTVLLVGHFAGPLAVAEMTAAVSVKLGEAAVVAYHRLQGGEGPGGAFLGEETRVQNAAVG